MIVTITINIQLGVTTISINVMKLLMVTISTENIELVMMVIITMNMELGDITISVRVMELLMTIKKYIEYGAGGDY